MKKILCLLLVLTWHFLPASGINKYALIIGIDQYIPDNSSLIKNMERNFSNLNGCVNDALSVKEILTNKFSFAETEFVILLNGNASRNNILKALDNIARKARKGDVVVIYYAGHGSQVKNQASTEADQMDETIVPSDSYANEPDIRDKEFNALFKRIADSGALLTAIFDSCHSGSIGRGFSEKMTGSRFMDPGSASINIKESSVPLISYNVLILSAALDEQTAAEVSDKNNVAHGVFTYSLIKVLNALPNNSSTSQIFESLHAYMKSFGPLNQEPVIEGNKFRNSATLIGLDRKNVPEKTLVTVLHIDNSENIQIQAGVASGLFENSVIQRIVGTDTLKILIYKTLEINKSVGKLIKGNVSKVKTGAPFEVVSWSVGNMPPLKIFASASNYSIAGLKEIDTNLKNAILTFKNVKLIDNPQQYQKFTTLFFNGKSWILRDSSGTAKNLGVVPDFSSLKKYLKKGGTLFVSYPAVKELFNKWNAELKQDKVIELTQNPIEAQYMLTGSISADEFYYSLIRPFASEISDSLNSLPLATDKIRLESENDISKTVSQLVVYGMRLSRIRSWLLLTNPPVYENFPYKLGIRNSSTGKIITNGIVKENDVLGIVLLKDSVSLRDMTCSRKYVYVFSIDNQGKSSLLFPLSNVENLLPLEKDIYNLPDIIPLGPGKLFRVRAPFGNDTYVMLATEEPLHNPAILNLEGVNTGMKGEKESDLWKALLGTGSYTRGETSSPSNWKKQAMTIRSVSLSGK